MDNQFFKEELLRKSICDNQKAEIFRREGVKMEYRDEIYGNSIICYVLKDLIFLDIMRG